MALLSVGVAALQLLLGKDYTKNQDEEEHAQDTKITSDGLTAEARVVPDVSTGKSNLSTQLLLTQKDHCRPVQSQVEPAKNFGELTPV